MESSNAYPRGKFREVQSVHRVIVGLIALVIVINLLLGLVGSPLFSLR